MNKIQNLKTIAVNELRGKALEIIEAGLRAIDTRTIVEQNLAFDATKNIVRVCGKEFKLSRGSKLQVIGIGKCALQAAQAIQDILQDRITGGVVIDVHEGRLKKLKTFRGTHPLPSEINVLATRELIQSISGLGENDLVLAVVSGGGSTLLCQPSDFSFEEEARLVTALMRAGATIEEINVIRKHISRARGGFLAEYAYPARVATMIFSDVPGNDTAFISSGPTVRDHTTRKDAEKVLLKYSKKSDVVFDVKHFIETPKEEKYFLNVYNNCVATNVIALDAMKVRAEKLGFNTHIVTDRLVGEARDAAHTTIEELHKAPKQTALLYGGETTVTVRVPGKGGRNQEFALAALGEVRDGEILIPFASDGHDNTDTAGGICDSVTKKHAIEKHLSPNMYLENNRSYDFFEATGDRIMTGDTGSNVSDLIVALKQ